MLQSGTWIVWGRGGLGLFGGPVPNTCGLPREGLPFPASGRTGLCEEKEDDGVAAEVPPGEDAREELDDRSRKEAVDEARSFEGIFECDVVAGEP